MRCAILLILLVGCDTKAPPMDGVCVGIEPQSYDGIAQIGPTVRCLWRSRSWDCTHHAALMGAYWSCSNTGPAIVEERP